MSVADTQPLTPRGALFGALAKAQAKIRHAAKDSKNPHFNSRYADLASVAEACREALTENGICVIQDPSTVGSQVVCTTTLGHASGELFTSQPLAMTPRDLSPQSVGSCVTYLRRYQLASVVGVAPDDDDGNAAQGNGRAEGKGEGAPVERAKRADKVKAMSDSVMATPDQVTLIHTLKSKIGGMTEDAYRKGLAAYKQSDGAPCTTSKELTEQQANNLIVRFRAAIDKQEANAARPVDLGAMNGGKGPQPANDVSSLEAAIRDKGIDGADVADLVLAPFGCDSVIQLDKEDLPKALALVLAIPQGKEAYERVMAKLGFPTGAVS